MATRRGLDGEHRLILVAVAVVLATVVALVLTVRGYRALWEETFRERSIAYVQAFSTSAAAWAEPPNLEMLQAAARLMLVGSAQYVQVELDEVLVVDERNDEAAALDLATASSSTGPAGESRRLPNGTAYFGVDVPLIASGQVRGAVRMGIDMTSIVVRGRSMAIAGSGVAIGIDVLVLALLLWSHRGRVQSRAGEASGPERPVPSPIVVGNLRIDKATKRVSLGGRAVALTPKQYALLEFLAERPDRVVSEKEIVEDVWSDSQYADSKDVKQYVYLVRKRLAAVDPEARELIATVPGFGYRLCARDVDEELTER